jgi:hypothetical protein
MQAISNRSCVIRGVVTEVAPDEFPVAEGLRRKSGFAGARKLVGNRYRGSKTSRRRAAEHLTIETEDSAVRGDNARQVRARGLETDQE